MPDTENLFEELTAAVRGGRVAASGFLPPGEAAALAARLRAAGAGVHLEGGYPGARRRVLSAFPEHIPEATVPLAAVYLPGVHDEGELRVSLERAGVGANALGDILAHQDGLSVILLAAAQDRALALEQVGPRPVSPQAVGLELVAGGKVRRRQVVVPSLRVDALGAKAFGVSRSYFSKGIAGGNVAVNGRRAGKSASAEPGDEVYAEGLGRFTVTRVQGETRRGNMKVEVEVEQG
ncbi:MAG TPA: hypothetical protein VF171_07930 [Trueperaceae bacterium]